MEYEVGTYISFKELPPQAAEVSLLVCWFSPGTKFIYDAIAGNLKPQMA